MTIFQELWKIDQRQNGCSVSLKNDQGSWINPDADVLMDEQVKSGGTANKDLAEKPLFHKVSQNKLDLPTYKKFMKLLNNYIVNNRLEEDISAAERTEIFEFFDAAFETEVMKKAKHYIEDISERTLTNEYLQEKMFDIWFKLYTNYYNGRSTHYCSGFEHVFVGEGKYNFRRSLADVRGTISGYHNWVKFYLDENVRGIVNYLGYQYGLHGNDGPDNPNVVTLQMAWNHIDIEGNLKAQLFKRKGGFFVGTSPECEFAMGTVAFFENQVGLFSGDKRSVVINGERYDLVLYRNTLQGGGRGNYIRSFFPIYLGDYSNNGASNESNTVVVPVKNLTNNGDIIITEALINPRGEDSNNEWVKIKNNTDRDISLNNWQLQDKVGRGQTLTSNIEAGKELVINIRRNNANSMQLGNGGGIISIFNPNGRRVSSVRYKRAKSGITYKFED